MEIIDEKTVLTGTPAEDGWIEWCGGECPVADGVMVDVRFRCGEEEFYCSGVEWDWTHNHPTHDIIAYRVLPA